MMSAAKSLNVAYAYTNVIHVQYTTLTLSDATGPLVLIFYLKYVMIFLQKSSFY